MPSIKVSAVGGKVKYPVYDDFAVLLCTKEQRFGMIELSWLSHETEIVYELRDSRGERVQIYRDFDYFLETVWRKNGISIEKEPMISVTHKDVGSKVVELSF